MEDILSCLCPLAVIVVLVIIIYYASNRNKSGTDSKKTLNKVLLLTWLGQMKAKGYSTIDELIDFLNGKNAEKTTNLTQKKVPQQITQKTTAEMEEKDEKQLERVSAETKTTPVNKEESKPLEMPKLPQIDIKSQLSNATFLLYLGSALILFAVFIFVAFNWQSFTAITKSLILVLLTFSFYLAGVVTHSMPKLKQASGTFLFIGSVCLGLTGIGLWNFNEIGLRVRGITFSSYWLFYSVILIVVYTSSYYLLKTKSYLYMTLAALYSILASIAFTVTNDDKFRIVLLALLNLATFTFKSYTGEMDGLISLASRAINYVLDVLIYIIVFSLSGDITTPSDQITALAALLIPTVFNIVSYLKINSKNDLNLTIITTPFKLLLFIPIFVLNPSESALLFAIYLIVNTLLRDNFKIEGSGQIFEAMNWFVGSCLMVLMFAFERPFEDIVILNTAIILTAANFTIPYILKREATKLAIGLNFIIPAIYKIYLTSLPVNSLVNNQNDLLYISIAILIVSTALNSYFVIKKEESMKYVFVPFTIINASITLILGADISLEKLFMTFLVLSVAGYVFKLTFAAKSNSLENTMYITGVIASQIFNVLAVLTALTNADIIYATRINLIASVALVALPILNLVQIFEGKISKESYITLSLIPFQLLTFCIINKFPFEHTIIIFTLYSLIKVIASEYYLKQGHFKLHMLSQVIFWTMLVFTTFFTTTVVIEEMRFHISKFVIAFVCIANLISFNLPAIIYKRYEVLMVTCNYLIFTAFRLLGLIVDSNNVIAYFITSLMLHIGGLAAHFNMNKAEKRNDMTYMVFIVLSAFSIIMAVMYTSNLYMMLGFGVVTATSMIIANFHRKDEVKYISVLTLFIAANFATGYLNEITQNIKYITDSFINTLLIIPAVVYMVNFDVNYSEHKILKSNIFGIIIFSVYSVLITADYYRVLVLVVLLAYVIYLLVRYKLNMMSYLVFFIAQLIHLQLAYIGTYEFEKVFLGVAGVSALFVLPTVFIKNYPKTLVQLGAGALGIIALLSIPYALNNPTNNFVLAGLIATVGLAIADRYTHWFGNIAGLAMLGVAWNLFTQFSLDNQFFIFALFLFVIFLSVRYYKLGNSQAGFVLEVAAYLLEGVSLLIDSIGGVDSDKILNGMLLIIFSSAVAIIGFNRKNKTILITGISLLILELIVRLYVVIVSLDWWVYLLVIGMVSL